MATRGRPAVYVGTLESNIVKVIRKHGLTYGRKYLAKNGVQARPGAKARRLKISMTTLGKLADRNGVKLTAGRPHKVA
jgi:hypothetical protein